MITIKNGPTVITGVLRTFSCGSNKIFLNLVPDMELEIRNVPDKIPAMMNSMGLNVVKDATIDINAGNIYINKVPINNQNKAQINTKKVNRPNQQPVQTEKDPAVPGSKLIAAVPFNKTNDVPQNLTSKRPHDNQPPGAGDPALYNKGRRDFKTLM